MTKTFVYKSKEDLINGIRLHKKLSKKKIKLFAVKYPRRDLTGIEDFDGKYIWGMPSKLAEKLGLEVEGELGRLASKLSTKSRKK